MIPITKPTLPNHEELKEDFKSIIDSGMITNAKYVKEFEKKAAEYFGTENTTALSSCTAGLIFAQKLLKLKGEVITPSFTFHATTHSLIWNNIKPVFVDIDENYYYIDPEKVKEAITSKTSAILAVHIFGHPASIKELQEIAEDHKLKLIFDAAHAFGSKIDNKPIGSFGDAEVFSLSPTKLITTGEGGLISSNNEELLKTTKIARNYGDTGEGNSLFSGFNSRMSEFHAALGLKTLEKLDKNVEKRNELAQQYKKRLSSLGVKFQKISNNVRTTFKDFSLEIDPEEVGITSEKLCEELKKQKIISRKYFYPPVHKQKAFQEFKEVKLPITEKISSNILSLPLYSHMKKEEVEEVCSATSKIIQENARR